ncbi:MAG: Ni/Fe-hydrogenase cytochrome b subunit [Acidobacteria bacterium]|nr:Ni/Fe-hydrogenase cytochrome b subunit [Acidobacteriota bacterium]MCG3194509.1 putative Ni/Fe-hydrogenase 2 b-type cytochrome subunit [Thermoanaerobaculia bacterium]
MSSTAAVSRPANWQEWIRDHVFLGMSSRDYLKSLWTPADVIIGLILLAGIPVIIYRFVAGLGAVTNLDQTTPWGLWIGLDVASGVALAAGGYTVACTVYIFGQKKYSPIVRPAVLTGMLGYLLVVLGLLVDLGMPWHLPYPLFLHFGTTSVMFELAWCVALYFCVLIFEFLPAVLEWAGLRKVRLYLAKFTIGAIIAGVMLSTLHQSSLGSLFLLVPDKLHPLWYSPFLPFFFFLSSIAAGIGMVIFESSLSHKAFHDQIKKGRPVDLDGITVGLSKGGALVLFAYFFLKVQGVVAGGSWHLLGTKMGALFLTEMLGFILLPSLLFAFAAHFYKPGLARFAAILTVLGIVLNRINVSWLALNWDAPNRYVPSGYEILTSLTIIAIGVAAFRWIVNRMPVLVEHPDYKGIH